MNLPPHRCVDCALVRLGLGADWEDQPGLLDGEIPVICKLCNEERQGRARRDYFKGVRRTRRRMAGREPWAPGTSPADPFENMREPRADKARG
jgi:hypothetical protein